MAHFGIAERECQVWCRRPGELQSRIPGSEDTVAATSVDCSETCRRGPHVLCTLAATIAVLCKAPGRMLFGEGASDDNAKQAI